MLNVSIAIDTFNKIYFVVAMFQQGITVASLRMSSAIHALARMFYMGLDWGIMNSRLDENKIVLQNSFKLVERSTSIQSVPSSGTWLSRTSALSRMSRTFHETNKYHCKAWLYLQECFVSVAYKQNRKFCSPFDNSKLPALVLPILPLF